MVVGGCSRPPPALSFTLFRRLRVATHGAVEASEGHMAPRRTRLHRLEPQCTLVRLLPRSVGEGRKRGERRKGERRTGLKGKRSKEADLRVSEESDAGDGEWRGGEGRGRTHGEAVGERAVDAVDNERVVQRVVSACNHPSRANEEGTSQGGRTECNFFNLNVSPRDSGGGQRRAERYRVPGRTGRTCRRRRRRSLPDLASRPRTGRPASILRW